MKVSNLKEETERRLKELRIEKLTHKTVFGYISKGINKDIRYHVAVLKQLNRLTRAELFGEMVR